MTKQMIKPFMWGIAAGSIAILIIVFATGWAVTSSSAQAATDEKVEKAVLERLAPICVAQYLKDPQRKERLKELKAKDSWKRGDYVKERGWAIMPGKKQTDSNVASKCAELILALKQK